MIFKKLEQRSLQKIGSVKSITEISDASTASKAISSKKFDDNESDITTTCNIDSISPIYRPKYLNSIILVKSKTSKTTYTNFDTSPQQSPAQDKKEELKMQLKISKNTLVIKVCYDSNKNSKINDGFDQKNEEITFEQLQRVSAIDIQFAPHMLISEDHLIMQEIKQIVDYFMGIYRVSLDLSYCKFETENVTSSISRMMKGMGLLTEIELNFTGCKLQDKFLNSLISEFKHLNLHNLRKLSLILKQNKIEVECMLFLSNLFEDMINLNNLSLDLQECSISNKMLSLISYHVSQNKKLKSFTMNLQNNLFNDDGIQQMCENLYTEKNFKLEEICLNLDSNKITKQTFSWISALLKSQKTLSKLSLSFRNYKFKSDDLKALGQSLNRMFDLKELHLNLAQNQLDDEFSNMLGSSFKALRELKVLKIDLSSNLLFKKGAQFLEQLFKSDSLEVFDVNLSNNKIGRGAGYSLATQIFFSAHLRIIRLDLSNNGMNGRSINCLLNQLKNNYSLEELYINFTGNNIERATTSILCENFSSNPLLRKLELIPRKQEDTIEEQQLKLNETKAICKYQNTLQFIAYQQQVSKYLIGNTYDIFFDIYDDQN